MSDRVVLLTGGTDGIGREVAHKLAANGAALIVVGRNAERGAALVDALAPADVTFYAHDLSLMREVDALIDRLKRDHPNINTVIHCAGVILREHTLTDEGLETVFAVQYLARYRLTYELAGLLAANDSPRVVNVSAGGSVKMELDFDNLNGEKHYDGVWALQHESVANDMLTLDLNERVSDVRFYCYGPGYVRTNLLGEMPLPLRLTAATFGRLISVSPEKAATILLDLLNSDNPGGLYGRLFAPHVTRRQPGGFRADPANRERLRTESERMIATALSSQAAYPVKR